MYVEKKNKTPVTSDPIPFHAVFFVFPSHSFVITFVQFITRASHQIQPKQKEKKKKRKEKNAAQRGKKGDYNTLPYPS